MTIVDVGFTLLLCVVTFGVGFVLGKLRNYLKWERKMLDDDNA